jgi:hypothetical protein
LVLFESGFIHSLTVFTDERFIGGLPATDGIIVVLRTVIFQYPGDNKAADAGLRAAGEDGFALGEVLPPLQPDKIGIKIEINKPKKIKRIFFFINLFPPVYSY